MRMQTRLVIGLAIGTLLFSSCTSISGFGDLLDMAMGPGASSVDSGADTDTRPKSPAASPASGKQKAPTASTKGSKIDSKSELAKYQGAKASSKAIPAGKDLSKQAKDGLYAMKAGAWAMFRITDKKSTSLLKMAILQEQGLWIYEIVSYQADGATVIQMGIKGLDLVVRTGKQDSAEFQWIKIKDVDGEITTIEGAMINLMGGMYKSALTTGPAETTTFGPGGPVAVPYGTFATTWLATGKTNNGKGESTGKVWLNTEAPLFHMVKSVNDDGSVMELVAGANSGYISELR